MYKKELNDLDYVLADSLASLDNHGLQSVTRCDIEVTRVGS